MIVGMLVVLAVAWTFNARRAVRGNDAARSDASASNWRWRDGIGEARMPPMMLLPLIDDALAACTNAVGPKPVDPGRPIRARRPAVRERHANARRHRADGRAGV